MLPGYSKNVGAGNTFERLLIPRRVVLGKTEILVEGQSRHDRQLLVELKYEAVYAASLAVFSSSSVTSDVRMVLISSSISFSASFSRKPFTVPVISKIPG